MRTVRSKLTKTITLAALALTGFVTADNLALQVGVGYRQDTIDWTTKAPTLLDVSDEIVDAKTNRHFKDFETVVLGVKAKTLLGCSVYSRASFDWGWVFDGRLRESVKTWDADEFSVFDNNGIVTEGEYSTTVVHNDEKGNSYLWDFNFGIGYPIHCWCEEFQISPMIGFSYDRYRLKINDKNSIFDGESSDSLAGFSNSERGHTSTYHSSWWGPWVGFDVSWTTCDCWTFWGEFEFHFGRARRKAQANTGFTTFDHYDKTRCFYGPTFRIGSSYIVCENWYFDASYSWSKWWSESHRDDLVWTTGTVRFDIGYLF